jgi:thiol-disulfide isomerase/thioredoxin
MTNEPGRRDGFSIFLVIACVALSGLVVALAIQNRGLKQQLAHGGGPPPPQFAEGDTVTPFPVVTDGGESKTINFGEGESKTLLLVFSSTCPACKETVPVWRTLLATPPAAGVRIVGLQTDRLDKNPAAPAEVTGAYPFPVYGYRRPSPDPIAKVPFIPAAVMLDPKGVVLHAWFGVPGDDAVAALKHELGG